MMRLTCASGLERLDMWMTQRDRSAARAWQRLTLTMAAVVILHTGVAFAQGLMGTLIGTVKDEQGGVLAGGPVSMSSPALIGRTVTVLSKRERTVAVSVPASRPLRPGRRHAGIHVLS